MTKRNDNQTAELSALVSDIETYISRFISFPDNCYTLPLALWVIGTYVHQLFDAFPYLVITADTKRAGKTRLAEILSFVSSVPRMFGAMTPGGLFRAIDSEHPTLFFDEAEELSSEAASTMRSVLNMGYRRGQTIPRASGDGIKDFATYCPKVFILIGDVADTLRDRSIIVRLVRGTPRERFTYEAVKAEGQIVGSRVKDALEARSDAINEAFGAFPGFSALTDRDEEIWTPLLILCNLFCPSRFTELSRYAVDLCTEKTQEARRFISLRGAEEKAQADEYSQRLLADVRAVMSEHRNMSSAAIIEALKAIDTAPWRKFRGEGITVHSLSDMLSRFGVKPTKVRIGTGRANSTSIRGYRTADINNAAIALKGGGR